MCIPSLICRHGLVATLMIGAAAAGIATRSVAAEPSTTFMPLSAFVQAGYGDQHTDAYVAGLTWYLPWHFDFSMGTVAAYAEASIGR